MKRDKLTLRAEIQADFSNETVDNINTAIKIAKCIRFLYKESTIFICSMIPMLVYTVYLLMHPVNHVAFVIAALFIVHYPFYHFIVKGWIFKGAKDTHDEFDYTVEVMEEIKAEKLK